MKGVRSIPFSTPSQLGMEDSPLGKATELVELTEALEAARSALEARDGEKALEAPSVEALERAHYQAVRAANRVGEQLVRDRLALGEIAIEPQSVSLGALLDELQERWSPTDSAARLRTEVSGSVRAVSDPGILRRTLGALLRAAADAADSETPVEIEARAKEGEALLTFKVEGLDLPALITPHLKKPGSDHQGGFPRAPLDLDRLGLRPFVEAQGGRVWVEELKPKGAALRIALPAPDEPEAAEPEDGHANTVLIVDDDPDGAFMLDQVLAKGGYETLIVHDGLSGLRTAKQEPISLILLDVMLPGMDGFEVCRRLRSDPATSQVPIIMISAKSRPEDRETGLKMGANAYMSKPLRLAEVLDKVGELLGDQETTDD